MRRAAATADPTGGAAVRLTAAPGAADSEHYFQGELQLSRRVEGRLDLSEVECTDVGGWIGELGGVEQVERFRPQLKLHLIGGTERLEDRLSTLKSPGPENTVRGALPNVPGGGATKQLVSNQRSSVRSLSGSSPSQI
jgi:hypothetical protein